MFWRFAISTLAAFAALTASPTVRAADMPLPPPAAAEPCCNWYLRGFVGEGMTNKFGIQYLPAPANAGNGFAFDQHSNADTFFIGGGVGYNFNSWLRFDGTAEYRGRTQVNARGVFNPVNGDGDAYQGYIKSWVFLANSIMARSPIPSIASAAASPIPISSTISVLTTSCLVCAGPAATWSSRARSTCRCTARVSHLGRSAPFG